MGVLASVCAAAQPSSRSMRHARRRLGEKVLMLGGRESVAAGRN